MAIMNDWDALDNKFYEFKKDNKKNVDKTVEVLLKTKLK